MDIIEIEVYVNKSEDMTVSIQQMQNLEVILPLLLEEDVSIIRIQDFPLEL